ncbi:helix-turn-helix domain-containing protein [Thermoactinomyces intermedius]
MGNGNPTQDETQCTRSEFYDPSLSTPAARIRNTRLSQNMTIKELAELSGLTYETISNIAHAKNTHIQSAC